MWAAIKRVWDGLGTFGKTLAAAVPVIATVLTFGPDWINKLWDTSAKQSDAVARLGSEDPVQRKAAIVQLAQMSGFSLQKLEELMGDVHSPVLRESAKELAVSMAAAADTRSKTVGELCRLSRSANPAVKIAALEALEKSFPHLDEALRREVSEVVATLLRLPKEDAQAIGEGILILRHRPFLQVSASLRHIVDDKDRPESARAAVYQMLIGWVEDLNCGELERLQADFLQRVREYESRDLLGRRVELRDAVKARVERLGCSATA